MNNKPKLFSNKPETTILLIRHGETDWNTEGRLQGNEDIELNDKGRAQAHEIAEYLKKEQWDMIISSPLKRAYETAIIISKAIDIKEIIIIEEFKERDYGAASGLLPEERRSRYPDIIPGQEEFEHLRQRAMNGLNKVIEKYNGKKIIIISHGGLINSILYTLSNAEYGSFKTRLKNGCINKIIFNNSWNVEFYNKTIEELISK
jgi:uncharacterized phosphatase